MSEKIEYRVRPVTRFVVTRYHESAGGQTGGSEERGEFSYHNMAYDVAYALCKEEHSRAGTPIDDPNFVYPKKAELFAAGRLENVADDQRRLNKAMRTCTEPGNLTRRVMGGAVFMPFLEKARAIDDEASIASRERLAELRNSEPEDGLASARVSPAATPDEIAERNELSALPFIKISFRPASIANPKSYMQASTSFPAHPGEDWRRGDDLPDGPFNVDTFNSIMDRIWNVLRENGMEN